jgi:hypothetical protein
MRPPIVAHHVTVLSERFIEIFSVDQIPLSFINVSCC